MEASPSLSRRDGFTLVEMVAVVVIIGVILALSLPWYLRSSEDGKASQASSMLNMLAAANRMYSLDHTRTYASGALTSACNSAACANNGSACDLASCRYLATQDWDALPYNFYALDPNGSTAACNLAGIPSGKYVGCAARRVCGGGVSQNCTSSSAYAGWGYVIDTSGVLQAVGGAPGGVD